MASDQDRNRPALAAWLRGAPHNHIFRPGAIPFPDDLYDRLDEVIAVLAAAAPPGLALKRKAFQNAAGPARALDARSELLVGALLVRAGFQMECPAFPDYLCKSPNVVGVEATTRERDDSQKLDELLKGAALPAGIDVTFKTYPAVVGNADVLAEIVKEVVAAGRSGQQRNISHPSGLELIVGPALDISMDVDEWKRDGDSLIAQCVRDVGSIVRKKQEQAANAQVDPDVPLVLVVDFSRFGRFGGFHVWAWEDAPQRLAEALADQDIAPFHGAIVAISNLQTNAFNGAYNVAPTSNGVERHAVEVVAEAVLNRRT